MDFSSSPGDPPPTLSTSSSSSSSNKYPQTPGTIERLPTVKDLLPSQRTLSDDGGAGRSREFKLSPMKGTLRETNNNASSTFPTSSSDSSLSSSAINLDEPHYHHHSSNNHPIDGKNDSHFTSFDSSPISGTGSSLFSSPFASTFNDTTTPAHRSAAKRRARSGASDQQGGVPIIKTRAQRRAETGSSTTGGRSGLPSPDDVFTAGRKRGRSAEDEGEDRSAGVEVEGSRVKEEVDVFGPSASTVVVAAALASSSGSDAVEDNHTIQQDSRKGSASSSSSLGGGEGVKSNKKKRAAPPPGTKETITLAIESSNLDEKDISNPNSSPHPHSLSHTSNSAGNDLDSRSPSWDGQIPLDRLPVEFQDSLHLHQGQPTSSHPQRSYDYESEHGRPPLDPSLIQPGQQPVVEHQPHLSSAPPPPPLPSLPPSHRFPSAFPHRQEETSNSLDLHFDQEISAEQMRLKQLEIAGEQQHLQMDMRHPQMTPQQQHAAATSFYESISGGAGAGLQLQQTPLSFSLSAEQLQILEQQQQQSLQFFDPAAPLSSTEAQNQLAFAAVFAAMGQSEQPGAFDHQLRQHGADHPLSTSSSSSSFQQHQNHNASSSSVPSSAIAGPSFQGFGGFPESPSPFQNNLGYQQAQAMLDAQGNDFRNQLYFNGEAGGVAQPYFPYGQQQQQQGVPPNHQFSFGAQQQQQQHYHHQLDVGLLDQMDGVVPQFGYPPLHHQQHLNQYPQLMPAFVPSPSIDNSNDNRPNPSRSNSLDDDRKHFPLSSPPSPSNSKLLPAAVTSIRPSGAAVTRRYSLPNKPGSEELTLLCPDASPPPNYRPATANAAARRPSMGSRSSSFNSGLGSLRAEEREKDKKPLTASGGVQVGRFGRHELKKPKFPFLKVAKKEEEHRKFGFGGNGEGEMGGEEGGREEEEEDDGDAEKIMSQFAMSGGGGMPRIVCTVKGCRKSFKHRGAALENHIKSHSSKPSSSSDSLDGPSTSTNNAKPSSSSKPTGARKASTGSKRRTSKYDDDRWNSDEDDDDEEDEAVTGDSDEEWREPVKQAADSGGGGGGRKRR